MSIETVTLNLDGTFATEADRAAAAGSKLAAALGKLHAESRGVKMPALVTEGARLKALAADAEQAARAVERVRERMDRLASQRFDESMRRFLDAAKTPQALLPKTGAGAMDPGGFAQIVGAVGKLFGPGAASGLVNAGAKLASASESIERFAPLLSAAGGVVKVGGAAVATGAIALSAAALGLTYAAGKIVKAAVEFGIEQTSLRERIQAAIGTGGYKVAINLAAQYGLDPAVAVREVKGLLAARFSETEIPVIVRIATGLGELKGEEKMRTFIEKIETAKNRGGKASEETIRGFAEAGVDVDAVWKNLAAKLGVSVSVAQAKVKGGAVSMKDALDAVTKAGSAQFGGVADKLADTVPSLVGRVKMQFAQLFSGFDLGPLKGALKNIAELLGGDAGKKLGDAFAKLGNATIKTLFGPFQGEEGKQRLTKLIQGITSAAESAAKVITKLEPYVTKLVIALAKLFGEAEKKPNVGFVDSFVGAIDTIKSLLSWSPDAAIDALVTSLIEGITGIDLSGAADTAGTNFVDGFVNSIEGGAGRAAEAAAAMGASALKSLEAILGIASPSKKAAWRGEMFGKGFAVGASNDNGVVAAGKGIAEKAMGGLDAGTAKASGGASSGGAGGVVIQVQVVAAPGASPQEVGTAIGEAAYAAWTHHARRHARERREAA